jgi:hypothetical protein
MAIATLDVVMGDDQEHLAYELRTEDAAADPLRVRGPSLRRVNALREKLGQLYADSEQRVRVLRQLPDSFTPSKLTGALSEWAGRHLGEAILAVRIADAAIPSVPWPEILREQRLAPPSLLTVHVGASAALPPGPIEGQVLIAGWGRSGTSSLPGIDRELIELSKWLGKSALRPTVLSDPDRNTLFARLLNEKPSVLHLSLWGLVTKDGEVTLPVEPAVAGGADFDLIDLDSFVSNVKLTTSVKLLVVNACHSAYPWGLELAGRMEAATIGWGGLVGDDVAADFSLYLYHRLLEGLTLVEALRSFLQTSAPCANSAVNSLPVLCFPSAHWLEWRPIVLQPGATTEPAASTSVAGVLPSAPSLITPVEPRAEPSTSATTPGAPLSVEEPWLKIDFRPRKSINPAMLINKESPIEHIGIESPSKQQIRLRIVCDTGRGTSSYEETHDLNIGPYPSMHLNVFFPALHELVEQSVKRRRVVFTLTADRPGTSTPPILVTKAADWMGATEWLDTPETWRYVPAFVNPFDPCVAALIGSAVDVLRTFGEPGDEFDGYQSSKAKPDHPERQVKAVFQTLRDSRYGIRYASPLGGVLADRGRYTGQIVRPHGDVIQHRLGTCHDLALLMAAAVEHVGLYPLIVLVQNHTFFGFWASAEAQYSFWKEQKPVDSAMSGSITNGAKLQQLSACGDVVLVDAVALCRPFYSYEKAKGDGVGHLTRALESPLSGFNVALDVMQIRGTGINPI